MSKRMYKGNYADVLYLAGWYPSMLNFAISIIFLFAAAYVHCLRFFPGQLTLITKIQTKL